MPWPRPPAPGVFCATPYHAAMREVGAQVRASVLRADWPAPSGVHALTTLRGPAGDSNGRHAHFNFGMHCGDDPQAVRDNREMLERGLELPSTPRWLRQVHGIAVARDPLDTPQADAAVSSEPGTVLAILTADCLPVVFAAIDGSEIAAAHAGWRGLAAGVLEATLAGMRAHPSSVIAWMGPAAGPANYEVGADVHAAFVATDASAGAHFIATRAGHWHVDLYALARARLVAAGMAPAAIHGGGLCTIGDAQRFFSHRREPGGGRMATLVWRDHAAVGEDV